MRKRYNIAMEPQTHRRCRIMAKSDTRNFSNMLTHLVNEEWQRRKLELENGGFVAAMPEAQPRKKAA